MASFLYDSGSYVSVVNAMLVRGCGDNSLRRAKTDKKDAIKLANYGLDHWLALPRYIPEDEVRLMLKTTYAPSLRPPYYCGHHRYYGLLSHGSAGHFLPAPRRCHSIAVPVLLARRPRIPSPCGATAARLAATPPPIPQRAPAAPEPEPS